MGVNTGGNEQATIDRLQERINELEASKTEMEKCMTTPRIEDLDKIDELQAMIKRIAGEDNILKAAFASELNGYQLESIIHKGGSDSGPKVMNGLISFVEKLVEHTKQHVEVRDE